MPRSEEHDRAAIDRSILKHCGLVAKVRESDAWLHFFVSLGVRVRCLEPLIHMFCGVLNH